MRSAMMTALSLVLLFGIITVAPAVAEPIGDSAFQRTWERTDRPVADGLVSRTWMWGPEAFSDVRWEDYAQSPGGQRKVQYFDKSRMEITNPNAVDDGLWYVTNGLLVVEMMTGRMQIGDSQFIDGSPAQVNVAGDPDDPLTYAVLAQRRGDAPLGIGAVVTQRISATGQVTVDPGLAARGVTAAVHVAETNHTVASVFWAFMNSEGMVFQNGQFVNDRIFINPYYATGFPITEAYWANVKIGNTPHEVLIQCFERRCLTYAPQNPAGWQVEAGNVGQHYYRWRYQQSPPPPPPGQPPAEGAIIYQSSLGNWPEQEDSGSIGGPSEDGTFYIAVAAPDDIFLILGDVQAGDASYSIDIFSIVESGDGAACLMIRASEAGAYQLCLLYVSGSMVGEFAFYLDIQGEEAVELGSFIFDAPRTPEQWQRIKIIAKGSEFWFFDGNTLVGHVTHHGSAYGFVGFSIICVDDDDVCGAGFRNLVIRSVSGGSDNPPPPPGNCHPSYPDHCVPPPPPDLNCADLPASWKPIRVRHDVPNPDPHFLDADKDGWGCESG